LDFVSYPYSHSLLMLAIWAILFGLICRHFVNDKRVLPIIAALVVSHWVLDFVSHRPDMPLYPGGPKFGLGLWYSVPATVVVEVALYAAGVWVYVRSTRARDAVGRWSFAAFAVALLIIY